MKRTLLLVALSTAVAACDAHVDETFVGQPTTILQGQLLGPINPEHTEVVLVWNMPLDQPFIQPGSFVDGTMNPDGLGHFSLPLFDAPPENAFYTVTDGERQHSAQGQIWVCPEGTADAYLNQVEGASIRLTCSATFDGYIIYRDEPTPVSDSVDWFADDVNPIGYQAIAYALETRRCFADADDAFATCSAACDDDTDGTDACSNACQQQLSTAAAPCNDMPGLIEVDVNDLELYAMDAEGFPVLPDEG